MRQVLIFLALVCTPAAFVGTLLVLGPAMAVAIFSGALIGCLVWMLAGSLAK